MFLVPADIFAIFVFYFVVTSYINDNAFEEIYFYQLHIYIRYK